MAKGLRRGIGTGCYIESASGAPHERAIVKVQPDKTVSMTIGTLSSGQGHETSFAQLLSEWLGRVPKAGESVDRDGIHAEVLAGNELRVEQVRLKRLPKPQAAA